MNRMATLENPPLPDHDRPLAAPETEAMLCTAMMLANDIVDRVADIVTEADFSDPFFAYLFSVIVREHSAGRTANPNTLRAFFNDESFAVIAGLTGSGGGFATIPAALDCARRVGELGKRCRLAGGLREAIAKAQDANVSTDEVAAAAEAALAELAKAENGTAELSGAECVARVLEDMEADRHAGVHSGLPALDAALGPLRPKSLNIIAGRPGMGKSATALSYALGAAKRGHGCLIISLEMAADEIGERMAADMCFDDECTRIPFNAIASGNCTREQKREIARAAAALQDLPVAVVDIGAATVGKIDRLTRRYARRFAARGQKLELVIVDYLGLVRPDRQRQKTYEEVSEVSRGLKTAAKQRGVALIALHQLSRDVERRGNKRPVMADLRDSGQIEQDADAILFLYAPEYYLAQEEPADDAEHAQWEAAMHEAAGKLEFIVAKRRRGPSAVGRGWFHRAYQAVRG